MYINWSRKSMLILSRNLGQLIHIGDNVVVKVIEINGKHVKIGIDAPKSVSVDREEIYLRKKASLGKPYAAKIVNS